MDLRLGGSYVPKVKVNFMHDIQVGLACYENVVVVVDKHFAVSSTKEILYSNFQQKTCSLVGINVTTVEQKLKACLSLLPVKGAKVKPSHGSM